MKHFEKESLLLAPVSRYILRRGFRRLAPEMDFYEFRIDLYGFSKRHDLTVAIELKLTRWKRAFEQALIYQLCADIVYVAVPRDTVAYVDQSKLAEHGIGLIGVSSNRCVEVLAPKASTVVRPHYRQHYVQYMNS